MSQPLPARGRQTKKQANISSLQSGNDAAEQAFYTALRVAIKKLQRDDSKCDQTVIAYLILLLRSWVSGAGETEWKRKTKVELINVDTEDDAKALEIIRNAVSLSLNSGKPLVGKLTLAGVVIETEAAEGTQGAGEAAVEEAPEESEDEKDRIAVDASNVVGKDLEHNSDETERPRT